MVAVEVTGGGKWRGIADAWRCTGGQSPCLSDNSSLASELKAKGLYTAAKYDWDKIAEDDSNFV
jgi:hypothetical protein